MRGRQRDSWISQTNPIYSIYSIGFRPSPLREVRHYNTLVFSLRLAPSKKMPSDSLIRAVKRMRRDGFKLWAVATHFGLTVDEVTAILRPRKTQRQRTRESIKTKARKLRAAKLKAVEQFRKEGISEDVIRKVFGSPRPFKKVKK